MKTIRTLGVILLGTVAVVFSLAFLILVQPRLVLNPSTLLIVSSLLSKSGTAVTWTSVDIQADSVGLLKKKLTLDFIGLCIREGTKSAYNGCFDRAKVSVVGGLVRFIPKVTEAGPIEIENGKVLVDLDRLEQVNRAKPKENERKKAKPFRVEDLAPGFLQGAQVHPIRFDVARLELREKKKRILGKLHLSEKDNRIELAGNASSGNENYGLSVRLVNDRDFWAWNHWNVQGNAKAQLADRRKVGLTLNVSPHFVSVEKPAQGKWKLKRTPKEEAVALDFSLHFTFQGRTQKASQTILADVSGSYVPNKLDAKISATARHLSPELAKLTLSSCGLTVERQNPSQSDSRYQMDCRIDGTVPIPPKHLRFFEIPTEAGLRVQADLMSSDFIPSDTTQLQGKVDAVLTPILTPIFEGRGELHSRLNGVAGEFPRSGQIDSQVAVEMRIPDFQKLNQRLNKTAWGIPAPFQALEGNVTFRSAGSVNLEQGNLPIKLQTRLKSNSQSVNLDAGGTVEVTDIRTDPWTQANFVLTLTDLKLLLPRLKLEKPPRLFPESRIHALQPIEKVQNNGPVKKEEEKEPSFGYRAVVRTPPGSPVQIITNLAKGPIPVNLDINLSSESPPTGKVQVGVFPVEAFRRKATVQHFDIDLVTKAGDSVLDGRVDVPLGDYQAHIDVVGSIDKPQVRVTSDPPVGEDQLLAALLFNRTPEELDPSESATVGSTRATVSQGALSLASLFLLASTPVEGLSYNPDTGQVTAQVRISEGLSLNVGSGENQAGAVGVRKRIGSNFFVTTNVNNIIQNSSTVSAYVEWRKRY
ncbi:MAG: translocation/assembly module TamB domain-containing protein [Bdellovibrionia bacterium]